MTTRWAPFVASLAVWLAVQPVWAQSVFPVRSGEQPNSARLVIPVPPNALWEFTNSGRTARFTVPQMAGVYDSSGVFDRISRTRILDIVTSQSGDAAVLELTLACECRTDASLSAGNVIIDVFDPEPMDIQLGTALGLAPPQESPIPEPAQSDWAALNSARPAPGRPSAPQQTPRNTPGQEDAERSAARAPQEESPAAQDQPDATAVTDMLLQQLERAAEEGFVQLAPEAPDLPPPPADIVEEEEPPVTPLPPFEETIDGMDGFAERLARAIEEGNDAGLGGAVRLQIPPETGGSSAPPIPQPMPKPQAQAKRPEHCLDEYYYEFSPLSKRQPPIEQIIALRAQLIGEFDEPDTVAAERLARIYITLGLGVEARALAKEFISDPKTQMLLSEMASVVEGVPLGPESRLHKAADCSGLAVLWRTAAFSQTETQPVANSQDVVAAVDDLPVPLRRRLVPRLVESFVARGQISEAETSFALLDRAPGFHGFEHEFQRAVLLEQAGQRKDAEAIYNMLARRSDPVSPKSAVALIDSVLERGKKVPPHLINDLVAMAHQYRGTETGAALRLSEIKAKAGNGRFGAALDVINDQIAEDPDLAHEYLDAANVLLSKGRSVGVTPGAFATAIFEHQSLLLRDEVTASARLQVAQDLIDIGLPEAAIAILDNLERAQGAQSPELAEQSEALLASAYLKMDAPERVLSGVDASDNGELAALRVEALGKLGRHAAALAEARLAQQDGDLAGLGFRAGNWEAAQNADGLNGALAQYMARREGPDGDLAPPPQDEALAALATPVTLPEDMSLEDARSVVAQSELIRQALGEIAAD